MMTDETMDEIAQWQHDSAWEFENDEFEIDQLFDCIHDDAEIFVYENGYGTFKVWECACGAIGEVGREN